MTTTFNRRGARPQDLAGGAGLVDAEALVRATLARTFGGQDGPPRPDFSGPSTGTGPEGVATGGLRGAVRDMLDRLSIQPSHAPLCETGMPGRQRPTVPTPEGARFEERVFHGASGSLDYRLYVPGAAAGRALPLVVMLHGCTQSPEDFAAGTRMNEIAEEQGFLVAYPRQTPSANMQRCWNWFDAKDQRRDRGEPALIVGITRAIVTEFGADPTRLYVAGLSAGGAAAAIMGQTYPDLYAAVGVHSGLAAGAAHDMPSAFAAMRQGGTSAPGRFLVPTIVFHGDDDRTVHRVNGDRVLSQAGAGASFAVSLVEGRAPGGLAFTRTTQRDDRDRPMLELWTLHGGGHAWSGGSQAGSYTEPRGPDASRAMIAFFLQHASAATPQ